MAVRILELCHVPPPDGSAPPCELSLTFFDVVWLVFPTTAATERVFFYHLLCSTTSAFLSNHLPKIKDSLSLALKLFYPLAGRLLMESETTPCIRYSDGDFVVLTVAESDDDLKELTSDGPKDNARFRSLVPTRPNYGAILAVQATLFPEQGLAFGFSALDAAVDGSSVMHFTRTWASICRSGSLDAAVIGEAPPLFDRSVILDPKGLQRTFLSRMKECKRRHKHKNGYRITTASLDAISPPDSLVRATFHLTAAQLRKLQRWVASRASSTDASYSSFTLAVALVWTCLLRARGATAKKKEALVFMAGGRSRLRPPVAQAYLGNCVYGALVEVEGSVLKGEDGMAAATVAIWDAIQGMEDGLPPEGLGAMLDTFSMIESVEPFWVVSSPKMRAYAVDFGWGKPRKVEVISIESMGGGGAMSLSENGESTGGGLEMGLALPTRVMENFTGHFHGALKTCR